MVSDRGEASGEVSAEQSGEPHGQDLSRPRKGGLRTMPFIIAIESFERVATFGLLPNMIFYLKDEYHMSTVIGSSVVLLWSALSDSLSIFGAFLSDSKLGRYKVIVLGSFSSLLGTTLFWLTTLFPQLKPPPCSSLSDICNSATAAQLAVLIVSFLLMSIGAGCIRPCSISFGADQLSNNENLNSERALDSFFNWYYASIGISMVISFTAIVYIQDHLGYRIGFGIPALLIVLSTSMFLLGSPLYVKVKVKKSILADFLQVIVAAFKKRNLTLPWSNFDQYYHSQDSKVLIPSNSLRCLNKACMIENPKRDLNSDGSVLNPWRLCTAEQVESLKSLLRILPMWSTGIVLLLCLNQVSLATLEVDTMDKHITKNFEIPAASFSFVMIVSLTIWIAFYDRVLVPLLAKHTGKPRGLNIKLRMGIGLVLGCVAMAIAATIESIRRNIAIKEGPEDQPGATIGMSAIWIIPQFVILGLAEAFSCVAQIEFFYSHFPKTMSSIAVGLYNLELALSSLLATALVNVVDNVTSKGGNESWLSDNLNKGHLDYYYWLLAVLGVTNFVYFLVCCRAYAPAEHEQGSAAEEDEEFEYRELASS